jgi:TorA-specific chaperone
MSDDTTTDATDGSIGDGACADAVGPARRHAARAAVYAALAGVFCYPEDDAVAELTADDAAAGLREAATALDGLDAAEIERFVDALDAADAAGLRRVYDDLFGVPDGEGGYPVTPYEAEYTVGDEVSHKQRRVATVAGLLDAFGLDRSDAFDERHDHVALECELLQVLGGRRAVAVDAGLDDEAERLERAEATVLGEHLGTFFPAFAAEVRAALDERHGDDAAAAAYRAAVDLGEALIDADAAAHPPGLTVPTGDRTTMEGSP